MKTLDCTFKKAPAKVLPLFEYCELLAHVALDSTGFEAFRITANNVCLAANAAPLSVDQLEFIYWTAIEVNE